MESDEMKEHILSRNEALQLIDNLTDSLGELSSIVNNFGDGECVPEVDDALSIIDKLQRYIENSEETCRKDADCPKQ